MAARHLAQSSRKPAQALALGSAVTVAVLSVPGVGFAASRGNSNDKQTICHGTNSNTNPYVVITPNKNGDVDGHAKHVGPIWTPTLKDQHIAWGDIIPPFDYNNHGTPAHYPGLNWDATGQAWFANGCSAPTGGGGGSTTGTSGSTGTTGTTTGETSGTTTGTTTGATSGTTTGAGGGATAGTFTGGGSGSFTSGSSGGGTFTGGGGGPTTLPRTGASFDDQVAYGGAALLAGAGFLLLAPRRRPKGKTMRMALVPDVSGGRDPELS
jgi:LPXTG-motif cell wall-anchored protein